MKSRSRAVISVLLLAALLAAGGVAYAQEEEVPDATAMVATELRTKPVVPAGQIIHSVPVGAPIEVLGRTANGNWLFVRVPTGATGWMAVDHLEVNVDMETLDVIREVELVPPKEAVFTVVADAALRDAAHDAVGEDIESIWEGRMGTLLGRSRAGNFVYVEMDTGATGWVNKESIATGYPLDYLGIYQSGSVEIVQPPPKDFTVAENTRVVDRPSSTNKLLEKVEAGRTGTLLGRTANGNFVYVEMDSSTKGWMSADAIESAYPVSALPVERSGEVEIAEPAPKDFTVVAESELADRPASTHQVVEMVWEGRTGVLLGRTASSNWAYVEMDSGAKGWLPASAVESAFPVSALPVERSGEVQIVEPTEPVATVVVPDTPLREVAHEALGEVVEFLAEGEEVNVLGITRQGNWAYVETVTGATGWVAMANVAFEMPTSMLPVDESGDVEIAQPAVGPTFAVIGDSTVRSEAHEALGEDLEMLWEGRSGTLLGRTRGGSYVYVETDTGAKGWLRKEHIETGYPYIRLPIEESGNVEIAQPASKDFTVTAEAELADRPAATHRLVEALWEGREGSLLGHTASGNWVYVEMDSGAKGWLPAGAIESAYPMSALPVERSGEVEVLDPTPKDFTVTAEAELADRPASTHHAVETLWEGREGKLLGRTASGNWVYVEMDSGATGWLSVGAIESAYTVSALPVERSGEVEIAEATPMTFTVAEDTELADRPASTHYVVEQPVWAGRTGTLVGRTESGNWVYVEMDSGATGWLPVGAIESAYPVSALPVERSGEVELLDPPAKTFTVAADTTLADRPSTNHYVVEEVEEGQAGVLLGRTANANWVYVEMDSGAKGWLFADVMVSDYPVEVLPVVRSQEVEIVVRGFISATAGVHMRAAPNLDARIIETLRPLTPVTLLARNAEADWVYVDTGEVKGWVFSELLAKDYAIEKLPVPGR